MKVPKEARKLARSLFRASLSDGRLDPARVRVTLAAVDANPPRNAVGVLQEYQRLARLELERRHAVIETAVLLEPAAEGRLITDLKTRFGGDITYEIKFTPALIGGMRIRLGSDVWDGSLQGRLNELAAQL